MKNKLNNFKQQHKTKQKENFWNKLQKSIKKNIFLIKIIKYFPIFSQVAFAVCSNSLVAMIPFKILRHFFADIAFKLTFRLICCSISAVINFHNVEYKPKATGFCVANHTSPLDVAILSTDCTFSLVRILVQKKLKNLVACLNFYVGKTHFLFLK